MCEKEGWSFNCAVTATILIFLTFPADFPTLKTEGDISIAITKDTHHEMPFLGSFNRPPICERFNRPKILADFYFAVWDCQWLLIYTTNFPSWYMLYCSIFICYWKLPRRHCPKSCNTFHANKWRNNFLNIIKYMFAPGLYLSNDHHHYHHRPLRHVGFLPAGQLHLW